MRELVLFGCGPVAENYLYLKPSFIVDNNPDMEGSVFHGVAVKKPSILNQLSSSYRIIICTTSVGEVIEQLKGYGFKLNVDIELASGLEENYEISKLESNKFKFLISCGLPSTAESLSGGGIYSVEETESYPLVKNIYKGNTHGLIKYNDGYAFTCQGEGVFLLDQELNIKEKISLPKGLRPHGLRRYKDCWVVASSLTDSIIGFDATGTELFKYAFSDKFKNYGSAQHHCNDLEVIDDYAYVSMFSVTGSYKRNIFDGGILEINLLTGEKKVVVNNLTMPHNITYSSTGFVVLNSFKGELLSSGLEKQLTLPGFLRGFDEDESYWFLGESKNRNFSRLNKGRSPVSIDTKITIVNKKLNVSRSIPLMRPISEIHSVVKI